ncbi:putative 1,3-beta-glucan synthase [Helianthus debilis subsp. tardiflorus]
MVSPAWVVLAGFVIIFKIFTFNSKKSGFQLFLRFIQGVIAMCLIAAVILFIILTDLSVPDLFSSFLAFVATGWVILSELGLWESVREFARMYDTSMGILIFAPIAMLSWFPFVSTFQSRLLFNQAFSRGLEISLILAGNKTNVQV